LLAAARWAGVDHVGYFSIVGLDPIPILYNGTTLRIEQARAAPGVGYPILRVAPVGDLIAAIFAVGRFSPLLWALRCVSIPPTLAGRVPERLVGLTDAEAAQRVPAICGLEVSTHTDLGHAYLSAHHSRRPVVHFPLPRRITTGDRDGAQRSPDDPLGVTQFDDDRARS
jgi:hypothetical protein